MASEVRTPVVGKIAKVLNHRQMVINKGADDGVEADTRFRVIEDIAITDPDTNEQLGSTPREVIRIEVIDVQPRFSIAQTYETYSVMRADLPLSVAGARVPVTQVREIASRELPGPDPEQGKVTVVERGFRVEELVSGDAASSAA